MKVIGKCIPLWLLVSVILYIALENSDKNGYIILITTSVSFFLFLHIFIFFNKKY